MNTLKIFIKKRRQKFFLYAFLAIAVFTFFSYALNFNFMKLITGAPKMFVLISKILMPNFSYGIQVIPKLFETIKMAVLGTLMGTVLAMLISVFCADNIAPSKALAKVLNAILAFFRTIPSLVWAALLVSVFSIGEFSGILALMIIAFLMSVKLFRENIEAIAENQINGIISVGVGSFEVLRHLVIPKILDMFISVFFIVLETNIRSATVLGLVGAGGIGQIMWRDLNHLRYDNLATIILTLFLCVILIDFLSYIARKHLKTRKYKYNDIRDLKRKKLISAVATPIVIIAVFVIPMFSIEIGFERFILGINQGLLIITRLVKLDYSYFPKLVEGLFQSLSIALFATIAGSAVSLLITFFVASNTSPNKYISYLSKIFINVFRTFPPIVTAIIFFRGVGPGAMAGAMALTIYTIGVLSKMYSEVIEASAVKTQDALVVCGASGLQVYRHGLLPSTFAQFLSLSLYRLESNIRNSAVLGIIGAGGIGTLMSMNITWRNWEKVGILVFGTSVMIIIIDSISEYFRRKLK